MPVRTVGEYLKRWGFTPQRPVKRACEQNPRAVRRWLDDEHPAIEARARAEEAGIHWGGETGLRSDAARGRGCAPKRKTPVARLSARRSSTNMISTVTNQGKVRFQVHDDSMTADVLKGFCRRLIRSAGRKVFLVLDNLRVHHARVFKAWLAEHGKEIEVLYLPSHSPEPNPDEHLDCDLEAGVHGGPPPRSHEAPKRKVLSHMRMLQKKPKRVAKYFQHRKIAYAA